MTLAVQQVGDIGESSFLSIEICYCESVVQNVFL